MAPPLLEVRHLTVTYPAVTGPVRAVRDLSFQLAQGEILALVGETGCGKSTVALSIQGLIPDRKFVERGTIGFEGRELEPADGKGWKELRGRKIGMVFQDARGSLNPVLTIGHHLIESLRAHQRLSRREATNRAAGLLAEVGFPEPEFNMRRYPFELSGGMCQRVGIALGICNQPRLLIADEPTSALDPTIQAQILDLLKRLNRRYGLALLLITHDLTLVSEIAQRIAVMYCGRLVESGHASEVLRKPAHPYTRALLESLPDWNHRIDQRPLAGIPGGPPAPGEDLAGCAFAPRCTWAQPECRGSIPAAVEISDSWWAACIKAERQPCSQY